MRLGRRVASRPLPAATVARVLALRADRWAHRHRGARRAEPLPEHLAERVGAVVVPARALRPAGRASWSTCSTSTSGSRCRCSWLRSSGEPIAATTLSAIGNAGWGLTVARLGGPEFAARWTAALTAPFVEEILKGCGVVLIYLIARDEVDDVMDGFVYGAICGLGFAIVEDVFYFMAVFGGQPAGVLQGFWLRVVASGLYGHVLYTGLVGMAVGVVVSRRATEPLATPALGGGGSLRSRGVRPLPVELAAPHAVPGGAVVGRRLPARRARDRGEGSAAAGRSSRSR